MIKSIKLAEIIIINLHKAPGESINWQPEFFSFITSFDPSHPPFTSRLSIPDHCCTIPEQVSDNAAHLAALKWNIDRCVHFCLNVVSQTEHQVKISIISTTPILLKGGCCTLIMYLLFKIPIWFAYNKLNVSTHSDAFQSSTRMKSFIAIRRTLR